MGESTKWKYVCTCGYETLTVGSAVKHINDTQEAHRLKRVEI
jgi:hypothetical protein